MQRLINFSACPGKSSPANSRLREGGGIFLAKMPKDLVVIFPKICGRPSGNLRFCVFDYFHMRSLSTGEHVFAAEVLYAIKFTVPPNGNTSFLFSVGDIHFTRHLDLIEWEFGASVTDSEHTELVNTAGAIFRSSKKFPNSISVDTRSHFVMSRECIEGSTQFNWWSKTSRLWRGAQRKRSRTGQKTRLCRFSEEMLMLLETQNENNH